MEEKATMGQGAMFAAPATPKKESQTTDKKTADKLSAKDIDIILAFLRQCGPYEADSIRAIVEYATSEEEIPTQPRADEQSLNRFLNQPLATMAKVDGTTASEQRQERAFTLLDAASRFLQKEQTIKATKFLLRTALSKKFIDEAVKACEQKQGYRTAATTATHTTA